MPELVQCAAILAGGLSSRMGTEKALLPFEGQPLIARTSNQLRPIFKRLVVVTGSAQVAEAAQLPSIADRFAGCGPLGGIHAALEHFGAPTFIVACDMPFLNQAFIQYLTTQFAESFHLPAALVPRSENGSEPLHAIYAPSCLPVFERLLQEGSSQKAPSMRFALRQIETVFAAPEVAKSYDMRFENWNTPDDIRA